MSDITAPACLRCRGQKLKCSRDIPKCTRCSRLKADCAYPNPPDRKHLASIRAPVRKRQRQDAATSSDGASPSPNVSPPAPQNAARDQHAQWPSPALQDVLVNLYFDCSFNAPLTLHRPTFDRQRKDGSINRPLLLAVCATGTNFFISTDSNESSYSFGRAEDIHAEGRLWAIWAGEQALQQVHEPSLDGIRTCQILALFWFAQDEPHRNNLFAGIAYRTARAMMLDSNAVHRNVNPSSSGEDEDPDCELKRRCFWASWTQDCVNSDHYIIGSSMNPQLTTVRLPISNAAFHHERPEVQGTLGSVDKKVRDPPSSLAELMRMLLNWARIRDHVETRAQLSLQEATSNLFALDQKLIEWSEGLPYTLRYSKRNLYEQLIVNQDLSYSALHALYHQSRLLLHSSLVPQLSGNALPEDFSLEVVRNSAKTALQSAQALSNLANDLSALEWDPARTAPFIGFCMYASAAIHLTSLNSRRPDLALSARFGLLSSLKLLRAMMPFWKHLERLWARIILLYKDQIEKPPLLGQPAKMLSHDELDDVSQARRDTSRLPEPLSRSLFHHGLSILQKGVHKDDKMPTIEQLEEEATKAQISQMAQALDLATSVSAETSSSTLHAGLNMTDSLDLATLDDPLSFQDLNFASINDSTFEMLQQGNIDTWWSSTFKPLPADMPFLDDLFDPFPSVLI